MVSYAQLCEILQTWNACYFICVIYIQNEMHDLTLPIEIIHRSGQTSWHYGHYSKVIQSWVTAELWHLNCWQHLVLCWAHLDEHCICPVRSLIVLLQDLPVNLIDSSKSLYRGTAVPGAREAHIMSKRRKLGKFANTSKVTSLASSSCPSYTTDCKHVLCKFTLWWTMSGEKSHDSYCIWKSLHISSCILVLEYVKRSFLPLLVELGQQKFNLHGH